MLWCSGEEGLEVEVGREEGLEEMVGRKKGAPEPDARLWRCRGEGEEGRGREVGEAGLLTPSRSLADITSHARCSRLR